MNAQRIIRLIMVSCLLLLPAIVWAQAETGNIVGIVRDTSGAVLPGVSIEAASPALIEKVRTAVSDEQGRYRIIDLRPGLYTVTFTLPGFGTLTAYSRKSGITRSLSSSPPFACGLAPILLVPLGASSASSGISLPLPSNSSSGR